MKVTKKVINGIGLLAAPVLAGILITGSPAAATEVPTAHPGAAAIQAGYVPNVGAWRMCAQDFRSAASAASGGDFGRANSYANAGIACGRPIFLGSAASSFQQTASELQAYIRQGNRAAAAARASRIAQAIENAAYAYERGDAGGRGRW